MHSAFQPNLDTLRLKNFLDRLGDVFRLPSNQSVAHLDQCHPTAKPTIHLREFQADVPSAYNNQVLRQDVDLHHARVREGLHTVEPRQRWDIRSGPHVDEELLRLELVLANTNPVWALEARMTFVDRALIETLEPVLDTLSGSPHDRVFPDFHALHVDADPPVDHHPIVPASMSDMRRPCARHEGLGRNASDVHAGATEPVALDDGDLHA